MTSVHQLHYTACRHGQGQGSGFQIRAQSTGLEPGDAAELVRLGLHTAPEHTPCPVALRVLTLASGRPALQRSVYLGQDYSGREGNFFTHSLVFPAACSRPDPFRVWQWPGWVNSLDEAGGDTAPPDPLPALDADQLATLPLCDPFDAMRLARFLRADPLRTPLFEQLLGCLALPDGARRPIILRDAADHLLPWLACLWQALPPEQAAGLALSTYQGEPSSRFDLMGTVTGTRCEPLPPNVFALFDVQTNLQPELPPRMADESRSLGSRLARRFFARAIPLDALRVALAHGDTVTGAQRLLRLHAVRHDLVDSPVATTDAVWGLPPLRGLGLAFTGTDARRLCTLLALLPPDEAAAWLASACQDAKAPFGRAVRQALPLLARVDAQQALALQAAFQNFRKNYH